MPTIMPGTKRKSAPEMEGLSNVSTKSLRSIPLSDPAREERQSMNQPDLVDAEGQKGSSLTPGNESAHQDTKEIPTIQAQLLENSLTESDTLSISGEKLEALQVPSTEQTFGVVGKEVQISPENISITGRRLVKSDSAQVFVNKGKEMCFPFKRLPGGPKTRPNSNNSCANNTAPVKHGVISQNISTINDENDRDYNQVRKPGRSKYVPFKRDPVKRAKFLASRKGLSKQWKIPEDFNEEIFTDSDKMMRPRKGTNARSFTMIRQAGESARKPDYVPRPLSIDIRDAGHNGDATELDNERYNETLGEMNLRDLHATSRDEHSHVDDSESRLSDEGRYLPIRPRLSKQEKRLQGDIRNSTFEKRRHHELELLNESCSWLSQRRVSLTDVDPCSDGRIPHYDSKKPVVDSRVSVDYPPLDHRNSSENRHGPGNYSLDESYYENGIDPGNTYTRSRRRIANDDARYVIRNTHAVQRKNHPHNSSDEASQHRMPHSRLDAAIHSNSRSRDFSTPSDDRIRPREDQRHLRPGSFKRPPDPSLKQFPSLMELPCDYPLSTSPAYNAHRLRQRTIGKERFGAECNQPRPSNTARPLDAVYLKRQMEEICKLANARCRPSDEREPVAGDRPFFGIFREENQNSLEHRTGNYAQRSDTHYLF